MATTEDSARSWAHRRIPMNPHQDQETRYIVGVEVTVYPQPHQNSQLSSCPTNDNFTSENLLLQESSLKDSNILHAVEVEGDLIVGDKKDRSSRSRKAIDIESTISRLSSRELLIALSLVAVISICLVILKAFF